MPRSETTAPAVVVCTYPEGWHDPEITPDALFLEPIMRFFRSSRRVNAVVLIHEVHKQAGPDDYGGLFFGKQVFFNPAPRLPLQFKEFLINDPPMTDALSANIGGQADMQRMFGYVRVPNVTATHPIARRCPVPRRLRLQLWFAPIQRDGTILK